MTSTGPAASLLASGFARYRETTPEARASFLEAIALGIVIPTAPVQSVFGRTGAEGLGDTLTERAMAEIAL